MLFRPGMIIKLAVSAKTRIEQGAASLQPEGAINSANQRRHQH
jgi:hypothetical protein